MSTMKQNVVPVALILVWYIERGESDFELSEHAPMSAKLYKPYYLQKSFVRDLEESGVPF